MLFKYNPDNTKNIHDEALKCLSSIKLSVYSYRCMGYTGKDGILRVISNPDKIRIPIKPSIGYSLFYLKCTISPKTLSENLSLINMALAVVNSPTLNVMIRSRHLAPAMCMGFYILIHSDNLKLLTKQELSPTRNVARVGQLLLCKPNSIGNGIYKINMDFDELKALQAVKELESAQFMVIKPLPVKMNKPLFEGNSNNYSSLVEESSTHETNTTSNTENVSNEQGAVGGDIQPQQLTNTEAATYDINFLTDVSIALEKLCEKYY
ncbi:hypothetical protein [Ehrlichia ruminantium]|nr:hypothetical protein [Ehrlichia ruminantium]QLK55222.1 hypothetical protein FDZ62_03065 [Ehrlichia ruminantium]QLK56139.1 hypothetical protein FDZ61_03060 [Ehrlichia ruminantium]UOD99346.1 hypothetical protein IMW62_03050 [Ehrlichia ruminantium]CAH58274.1 hypothetical protein Erum5450 [Ehrlichia ruminantium str. Welgevonden]